MRQSILFIQTILLLGTFCMTEVIAQSRIYVGLANSEDPLSEKSVGIDIQTKVAVQELLSASTFKNLVGCKAVGLRYAFGLTPEQGMTTIDVFLRNSPDRIKAIGHMNNPQKEWNECLFTKPYTLKPEEDIYLGYAFVNNFPNHNPILTSQEADNGGLFIRLGTNDWIDGIALGHSNILAQLIIEGPEEKLSNAALLTSVSYPTYPVKGQAYPISFKFRNVGLKPIKSITFAYQIDAEDPIEKEITFDTPIPVSGTLLTSHTLPDQLSINLNKDKIALNFSIVKVNGETNATDRVVQEIISPQIKGATFQRTILVEQFSTERCKACPSSEKIMEKAYETFGPEKVAWLVHHVGFGVDFLTLEESKSLLHLYPDNGSRQFAPAMMVDRRTDNQQLSSAPACIAPIPSDAEKVIAIYNEEIKKPAYAQIKIDGKILPNNKYQASIYGQLSSIIKKEDLRLSVLITESYLTPHKQEGLLSGDSFRHMFAPRLYLTPHDGIPLEVKADGSFSFTKVFDLDPKWQINNCNLVAFVHQWNSTEYKGNEVLNVAKIALDPQVAAIDETLPDTNFFINIVNGEIISQPEIPAQYISIYNLEGVRINPDRSLPQGILIIKINLPGQTPIIHKLINQ